MHRYQIILFCNLTQRRILFRCRTIEDAKAKYKLLTGKVKPLFEVEGRNKKKNLFHLGLVTVESEYAPSRPPYTRDHLGRNVTMTMEEGKHLVQVTPYWLEEKIYDNQQKKHIYLEDLLQILDDMPGIKMVYKLNLHVFVENDGVVQFYSLKNVPDAERLILLLMDLRIHDGGTDCLFSKDIDTVHRKYLYEHLEKSGYPKSKMYRHYSY